jgi:putative CocE/NonD family hydrolase
MRAVLLTAILIAPLLAGCFTDGPDEDHEVENASTLASYNTIPEGAQYIAMDGGMSLVWKDQERPFNTTFALPEGATMVRFVADPGEEGTVGIAMWNTETGRRRCNQQTVIDLDNALTGPRSCSSIAAIDDPGTLWDVVTGSGEDLPEVRIEFYHTPLDGPAANVDWSLLSKATHELQPTTATHIQSFDGTNLWVEVTLPEGDGPWPTIISSSPYNGVSGRMGDSWSGTDDKGMPAMWTYWTQDWAKRGYAAINIDVRGYGLSEGCIEVWGPNEQLDQKFIVEWAGQQSWSNGHMGFYGQSYLATTPLEAAVHQAKGLDAIIMVAPVVDSYFDWHYGGVPNGESSGSPAAYSVLQDAPATPPQGDPEDPDYPGDLQEWGSDMPTALQYTAVGACDPTLAPRANDPRAIHGEFYDERDFGALAGKITAATLYTQGFEDANVKSAMIQDMWNDIDAPKLGLFGHWLHQHPARMDAEALFLGWMDEHVKGIDLGLTAAYPDAIVTVDSETRRAASSWPQIDGEQMHWNANFDGRSLEPGEGSGSADVSLLPQSSTPKEENVPDDGSYEESTTVILETVLDDDLYLSSPELALDVTITQENAMIYARIDEVYEDGSSRVITWGMKNLALGDDYDTYDALTPGERYTDLLPFRPTEHILEAGSTLRLTLRGVESDEPTGTANQQPGAVTFHGEGTGLLMSAMNPLDYTPIGLTELP